MIGHIDCDRWLVVLQALILIKLEAIKSENIREIKEIQELVDEYTWLYRYKDRQVGIQLLQKRYYLI